MGASIIEVGIGLVLVYSLLSLLVSQINNIIKNLLNVRGQYIQQELVKLLEDPEIRQKVLSHPAIGLSDNTNKGDVLKALTAEVLTDVLIDILAGNGEMLERLEKLHNSTLVATMLDSIGSDALKIRLQEVLATARNLPNAKEKLNKWFDTGLTRSQELYKRRMQFFSLVVGAVLAVLLNVDTIYVAEALWNDPILRQATVGAANVVVEEVDATATDVEGIPESIEVAQGTVNTLLELRLPVGWYVERIDKDAIPQGTIQDPLQDTRNLLNLLPGGGANWFSLLVQKIIGLTLTTIAVMQGAPFWFDLLRRATGR